MKKCGKKFLGALFLLHDHFKKTITMFVSYFIHVVSRLVDAWWMLRSNLVSKDIRKASGKLEIGKIAKNSQLLWFLETRAYPLNV